MAEFISEKQYKKGVEELNKSFEKEEDLGKEDKYFKELIEEMGSQEAFKKCYDNITAVLDYYMDLDDDVKNMVTLWIIGTHLHDKFTTYPYLFLNSMRGSGKTRLLKIITAFSKDGQWTSSLTESVMFRTTGTLALDEFESVGSKDKQTLRELLNSSYKKGMKIFRMAKKKTEDGEAQMVEEFEVYRPVVMANIWGMEEVLGDRCINVLLEKSTDQSKIRLIENFEDLDSINYTKKMLDLLVRCSLCSVVTKKNINIYWNDYVKLTTPLSFITHTTLTTLTTTQQQQQQQKERENLRQLGTTNTDFISNMEDDDLRFSKLFKKIGESEIDGRYLELFFPIFLIAEEVGGDILDKTIIYAKKIVNEKKIEELTESRDVMVYSLIAKQDPVNFKEVKSLTEEFKWSVGGEEAEWLNSKWMGRALKRLNLVREKRRVGKGVQVLLNVEKAKTKEQMFKPKEEEPKKENDKRD